MSFVYPRTIAISRPAAQSGVGAIGYGGQIVAQETSVATGVKASIQEKRSGNKPGPGLPGDGRESVWRVFFKGVAKGVVKDRDVITDDEGWRYQVIAAYWNSLGWNCDCQRLET